MTIFHQQLLVAGGCHGRGSHEVATEGKYSNFFTNCNFFKSAYPTLLEFVQAHKSPIYTQNYSGLASVQPRPCDLAL